MNQYLKGEGGGKLKRRIETKAEDFIIFLGIHSKDITLTKIGEILIRLGVGCCTVVQNLIRKMNEILATRCHCITSALVELKRRIDFWVLKLEESKQNHYLIIVYV